MKPFTTTILGIPQDKVPQDKSQVAVFTDKHLAGKESGFRRFWKLWIEDDDGSHTLQPEYSRRDDGLILLAAFVCGNLDSHVEEQREKLRTVSIYFNHNDVGHNPDYRAEVPQDDSKVA